MTRQEKIWSEYLAFKEEKKRTAETEWMRELPPLGTCIDITANCGQPGRYESTVRAWINATFSQEGKALMSHLGTFEVHDEDGSFLKKLEWRAAFSEAKAEAARRFSHA